MSEFCCEEMREKVHCVDLDKSSGRDKVVFYSSRFDEYGIPIFDGEKGTASSYIVIQHCPWCGKVLPESKRDEWFDLLEKQGYDTPLDQDIPVEFQTSAWYESPVSP